MKKKVYNCPVVLHCDWLCTILPQCHSFWGVPSARKIQLDWHSPRLQLRSIFLKMARLLHSTSSLLAQLILCDSVRSPRWSCDARLCNCRLPLLHNVDTVDGMALINVNASRESVLTQTIALCR